MTGKSLPVNMKMMEGFTNNLAMRSQVSMDIAQAQTSKKEWAPRKQADECVNPEYTPPEFEISQDGSWKGAGGKPKVHFILGEPGSGKSTNCKRIAEAQGFRHISVGQLLRQEAAKPSSKYGESVNKFLDYDDIIQADVAIEMMAEEMKRSDWANKTFLIDGFPRNLD